MAVESADNRREPAVADDSYGADPPQELARSAHPVSPLSNGALYARAQRRLTDGSDVRDSRSVVWPGADCHFLGNRFKISNALMEITIGIAAGAVATHYFGSEALGAKLPWVKFIASTGAVVLTLLAGDELDPATMRTK